MSAPVDPTVSVAAGVAAAGFALARMLVTAPDPGLLERFETPGDRQSWPIRNETSLAGLRRIARGFDHDRVRAEWVQLLGQAPGAIELRESWWRHADSNQLDLELRSLYRDAATTFDDQGHAPDHLGVELGHLAELCARYGRSLATQDAGAAEHTLHLISTFSRDHVIPYCADVGAEIGDRAGTALLVAMPDLLAGWLEALVELQSLDAAAEK